MSINTDLNVDPYFDDFDETKQFVRVLFKPARSVQARELTQLQTILQNQIERFGSNVYKEGTVISGINITELQDIFYVKVDDDVSGISSDNGLLDFVPYRATAAQAEVIEGVSEGDIRFFELRGASSGLKAQIIAVSEGFETRAPDLKTFYIKYNGSTTGQSTSLSQFESGEELEIYNPDGARVGNITVTTFTNHVGRSFGVSIEDGIVYQKGHFVYVEPQTLIVNKYSSAPADGSIGFTVEESIVTSNQDQSLLDNAQGYNNANAPGADRLKLRPLLVSYLEGEEPEEFFSLIRFKRGKAVTIRDITEFNSVSKELARRTYDESGHYVVNGLKLNTELLEEDGELNQYVSVSPGKAYVRGFEVKTLSTSYLPLENLVDTTTLPLQGIGVEYGNYFEYANGDLATKFELDGREYNLYTGTTIIGRASVKNVEKNKIYVYNVRKVLGEEQTPVDGIGGPSLANITSVTPGLKQTRQAPMIFDIGKRGVVNVSNLSFVRRVKYTPFTGSTATSTINIPFTGSNSPLANGNYLVLDSNNNEIAVNSSGIVEDGQGASFLQLNLASQVTPNASAFYYDERVVPGTQDTKENLTIKVQTTLNQSASGFLARRASLGVPDAYQIDQIWLYNQTASTPETQYLEDLTNKFTLVSGQKDGFYDYSYIELKAGESVNFTQNSTLLVIFKCFRRLAGNGAGFLTATSYSEADLPYVKRYSGSNGVVYDLTSSIDFRPSVAPLVNYHTGGDSSSPVVTPGYADLYNSTQAKNIANSTIVMPANRSEIIADVEFYLPRKDTIAINFYGEISLLKGKPALIPSAPQVVDELSLGEVYQETNALAASGAYAPKIKTSAVRRYTMRDIDQIFKQVDRLTEITSMSMLENSAKDLLITDANGNNRFKNGILADPMKNLRIADVTSADFKSAIDKSRERLMPAIREFPISLKRGNIDTDSLNVDYFKDVVTKANSGTEVAIEQPYATAFRNCVSNYYLFRGRGGIFPEYDAGIDRIPAGTTTIEFDLAEPLLDLVNNLQAGNFIPSTGERIGALIGSQDGRTRREGDWLVTPVTNTFELNQYTLTSESNFNVQNVGNFVTDVTFNRYIETKDVKVFVWGLRPNTLHKFYFSEDDVTSMVARGTMPAPDANGQVDVESIEILGDFGETVNGEIALQSDDLGRISAVFRIPERTYFIGEHVLEISDALSYTSLNSSRTSYARFVYRAYNMDFAVSELNASTRMVDFDLDVNETSTTRPGTARRVFSPEPEPDRGGEGPGTSNDPIAQTFFTKSSMSQGTSYMFIESVDLWFRTKDPEAGFTFEIRETENGYPSRHTLPFGSVHVASRRVDATGNTVDVIRTSQDASVATNIKFPNPVRLATDSEYCFVVVPDGANPNYNIFTSKVGGDDLITGQSVTQDWGDGVLFTSTNNSAWKSYQDEDIKFRLNRYNFSTNTSYINLYPNDMEFFEINAVDGTFKANEIAYARVDSININTSIANDGTTEANNRTKIVTANNNVFPFTVGNYVILEQDSSGATHVAKIKSISVNGDVAVLQQPLPSTFAIGSPVTVTLAKGGIVSFYDQYLSDQLHLKESSATTTHFFEAGNIVYGATSGARCEIGAVIDIPLSFVQNMVYTSDTLRTSTNIDIYDAAAFDKNLLVDQNTYMQDGPRNVESKSNIVNPATPTSADFNLRVTMDNKGFSSLTPILDDKISSLNAYQYFIEDSPESSSSYVSKEVTLSDDFYAEGLRVLATLHRPSGTDVTAYARFKYKDNEESFSQWVELTNLNSSVYSSKATTTDYREFEYMLDEGLEKAYVSFQVKFSLTSQEGIHLTPYIKDYRAIALS